MFNIATVTAGRVHVCALNNNYNNNNNKQDVVIYANSYIYIYK